MIRVLYFASLRERLGLGDETLQANPATVAGLREALAARGDAWHEVFAGAQRVLVAARTTRSRTATRSGFSRR